MAMRLGLGDLIRVAPRALGRYTGTLLSVFVVQTIVTIACMLGVTFVLAATFGKLPMWDDAVDGDLVSLIWCLRHGGSAIIASTGVVFGALLIWQLVSWVLVGGLLVLLSYLTSLYAPLETLGDLSSGFATASAGGRRGLEGLVGA